MRKGDTGMQSDPALASQAASLRAGISAVVVIVAVCFGAAIALSDPREEGAGDADALIAAASAE